MIWTLTRWRLRHNNKKSSDPTTGSKFPIGELRNSIGRSRSLTNLSSNFSSCDPNWISYWKPRSALIVMFPNSFFTRGSGNLTKGRVAIKKTDEFSEKFQRGGGGGSFPIQKFILQIFAIINGSSVMYSGKIAHILWPPPSFSENHIAEFMTKVPFIMAKICNINFWIGNDPPPFGTFPKIHPFWSYISHIHFHPH